MNSLLRAAAARGAPAAAAGALRANLASSPCNVASVTILARSLGPGFSGFDFGPAAGARSFAATNAAASRSGLDSGHPAATASDVVAAATHLHQAHNNESWESHSSSVAGFEPRSRGRGRGRRSNPALDAVERHRRNQSTIAGNATAKASAASPPPYAADAAAPAPDAARIPDEMVGWTMKLMLKAPGTKR